ncbi:hypothetical protein FI667_g10724, partial [Globisporangium splendens]
MVLAQPEDAPPVSKKEARFVLSPFPPVRLSASECERIERLVKDSLQKALREYEAVGAPPTPREFPKNRWKVLKTHHSCTAYLDRYSRSSKSAKKVTNAGNKAKVNDISIGGAQTPLNLSHTLETNGMVSASYSSSDDDLQEEGKSTRRWPLPDIVVSGSVPGTLDDVMYGMMTPDSAEMLLHTAYIDDSLVDGGVLQQLQLPTANNPFRSVCVKWCVRGTPPSYMNLVSARDAVFVEATGEVARQDGVRLGYLLRHWLDLEGCTELKGLERAWFSSCAIYTPLSNHTVDIFVRGNIDPGGNKITHQLALPVAAAALLLRRSLAYVDTQHYDHAVVERFSGVFCKNCVAQANQMSAFDVAQDDILRGRYGAVAQEVSNDEAQPRGHDEQPPLIPILSHGWSSFGLSHHADAMPWPSSSQLVSVGSAGCATTATDDSDSDLKNSVLGGRDNEAELEEILGDDVGERREWATASSAAVATSSVVPNVALSAAAADTTSPQAYESGGYLERQELWRKMAELRLQAETVYQMAKHNSEVHVNGAGDTGHQVEAHCDSDIEALD